MSYFLLINYKTKERYLCSWFENEPDFYGQKVNFIGTTPKGLGGYNQMLSKGFIDRRFSKDLVNDKELEFMLKKRQILINGYYKILPQAL